METVINIAIPHVGEHIFEYIDTPGLLKCLSVSKAWKFLGENVLAKRWKGKPLKACELGLTKVVQVLLEHPEGREINWNARICGETAWTLACEGGHTDLIKLLLDYAVEKSIDLNKIALCKHLEIITGFMMACYDGRSDIVKLMLEHENNKRIDWNATGGRNYRSAFHFACLNKRFDVILLLMDHSKSKGIDLNKRDRKGKTALLNALSDGQTDVVKMLVQHANRTNIELPIFSMCRHLKYSKNPEITFNNYPEKTELRRSSRKKLEKIYLENGIYLTVLSIESRLRSYDIKDMK